MTYLRASFEQNTIPTAKMITEDKTVKLAVFLPESTRLDFKVEVTRQGTTMSAKCLELIEEWLKKQKK